VISSSRTHPSKTNVGKHWPKTDLFFLKASIESGMSVAEVAGFLRRRVSEVREKARELRARPRPRRLTRRVRTE
jgi:hypothetical protein